MVKMVKKGTFYVLFTFFPSLERTNGLMGASGRPRKTLLVQVLEVPVPKVAILWHHWGRKDANDHSLFESPGDFLVTFDHKTGFWAPKTNKGTAERVKKCMPVVPHPQRSYFEMKFPRQLHHIRVLEGQNGEKRHFLRSFLRLKGPTVSWGPQGDLGRPFWSNFWWSQYLR